MPIRLPASPRETQANQYAPHRREIRLGIVAISAQVGLSGYPDSPTSSGTSISCARSPPTPSAARAGSSCHRRPSSGTRPRTRCPPTPRPRSRTSTSRSKRSCSTAGSCQPRATPRSRTSPTRSTSPAPGKRVAAHPPPPTAIPHRRRRPDQPPQTRLRPGPLTPQRRHRPPDLGRMGGAQLQHRDLHQPRMTPQHPETRQPGPKTTSREAKTRTRPRPRLAGQNNQRPLTSPPGLSGASSYRQSKVVVAPPGIE